MSGCDMVGGGKVTPVIKRGPPAAALESPVDVERVAALVPKDNSYANKTTSISLTISGTCISQSVAVKVSVVNAEVKVTLDCDGASGAFASELDLRSVPDGEVQLGFGFLKSRDSTAPIYELTRTIIKDTEDLPAFTVPVSLTESNSGTIAISEVAGAATYKTTFTPQGGGTAIGPIETTLAAVPVTGLTVGTTYDVTVVALDAAGNETAATNTGTFAKSAPPNPTGLTATAATSTQVNLSWTSGGGSTAGYKIAYASGASAPANCGTGTVIPSSSISGTSHLVTGLTGGTQYSFRVCSVNNDTTPAASSGVTATATPEAAPPDPTSPSGTAISATQIDLSWSDGGGTTAGYKIAYVTGLTAPTSCTADAGATVIQASSITGTSHSVTGLMAGTMYSFLICAINGNATPEASSGVSTVLSTLQSAPPNPTGPTATAATATTVSLSWTSGGGSTVDYRISYQSGASAPADCASGTTISEASVTGDHNHTVTGLTSDTQYSFRICAINGNATPDVSSGVTASATPQAAPPDPTGPSATAASSSQINLSWTSGGGTTADYRISYASGGTAPADCATDTTISASSISGTSHSVTGLSASTQYSFRICAINSNATPEVSNGVTATATTSAGGGGGGANTEDLNLTYWIDDGSAAGYMYGPVSSSSWTDSPSFAPSLSSGYIVAGSALTLGKNSAPWVAVTSKSSGGDFRGDVISTVNLGGGSFSGNAFTLDANLITGNSQPTGSISIASVNDGADYLIIPATGWSLLNPGFTHRHRYVFNVLASIGSAFSGVGDWVAGGELHSFDDDGAVSELTSASKAGVLHQVGVRTAVSTDPYLNIIYGTYSNPGSGWAWSAPSVAALNKTSDGSTNCRNVDRVAVDFDRMNSAHGLHMVYMCEYLNVSAIAWQIVHLWNNGSNWISQLAVSSTDLTYTNYASGNRLGFSVENGKALLVYWSPDGSLQAKYGTFDSGGGQYNWSAPATQIATKDSTVQYFADPQVAIASDGTGRVAYLYRENPGTDSVIAVAHDSTGTWQTLNNLKRAAALRLGQGLGITGLAGNSEQ
jgi:hypothetical protein